MRSDRAAARAEFEFLKRCQALDGLLARAVALDGGWLIPVGDLHLDDEQTIEKLARWRAEHMDVHPTQFQVSIAGTRDWLRTLVEDPARLLFLVADRLGRPVGQLGFTIHDDAPTELGLAGGGLAIELGYVIGGEPRCSGLMVRATLSGVDWCRRSLPPHTMYGLTFSDNRRALQLYEFCGGVEVGSIPLRRQQQGERIEYRPLAGDDHRPADRRYVVIALGPPPRGAEAEPVPLAGPSIGAREVAYALDAVKHGWNERRCDYLERLAGRFGEAAGVRYALPTSSCTGAMHLALLAEGIGAGDEVVVPDISWVATANAVALTGARPVFADIESESWGLDPDAFQAAISPLTRAVIPVHLYGYPARIREIHAIADEHGLLVLEDAAAAIGAYADDRPVGSWGDCAAFSFQGAKLLVTGEGGMLVTDDEHRYRRAAHMLDQARGGTHPFWVDAVTPKYKMSNVQAAIGLAQLERLPWLLDRKRTLYSWYRDELEPLEEVALLRGGPSSRPSHWMASILLGDRAAIGRDELARQLAARGIDTRPAFLPLSTLPMWQDDGLPASATGPVAARVARAGLNLPSGLELRREQVAAVGTALRELLGAS